MHEAKFWKKERTKVKCELCPHNCAIERSRTGICRVRRNHGGKLYTLVFGKPVAINVDPIEKKPLYHFHPGTTTFSIGTVGCNMACEHCQNWDISCADPDKVPAADMPPQKVVEEAIAKGCNSISYTYNEPTVFYEYALACAKIAKQKGLSNILVTNGFINKEPAIEFMQYMDAANVDLKSFTNDFYKKVCKGQLKPVLETLRRYKTRLWIEVTNLLINGKNDDMKDIGLMCEWIEEHLGKETPLHFSRAFPMYIMQNIEPTEIDTLMKAQKIARQYLDYVYIGNTELPADTHCPKCGKVVIDRKRYSVKNHLEHNKCVCGAKIAGLF